MHSSDAQSSLDDIWHFEERAREEYVHHGFSPGNVAVSAVVLFLAYASFDLPPYWSTASVILALGIYGIQLLRYTRRSRVRRGFSVATAAFYLGAGVALIATFLGCRVIATLLELPAPGVLAAAGMALVSVPAAYICRPLFAALLRAEDR